MKTSISTDDKVTLKLEGNDVLVNNIIIITSESYSGIVYGFEPDHLTEVAGIKIGDKVDFNDCHIISHNSSY